MIEIKSWMTGLVIAEYDLKDLRAAVIQAVKDRANLRGADLSGAYLREADLSGAYLREADLREADLRGANLRGAYLRGAYLREADLREADLRVANLRGADLSGAYLREADLSGAYLPTGETMEKYLSEVVPALLVAGGRPIPEVASPEHWSCHDWDNCPMAAAFHCSGIEGVPVLLRPRAEQFVQMFDAGLIPMPTKKS